jgi:hypothetical protein
MEAFSEGTHNRPLCGLGECKWFPITQMHTLVLVRLSHTHERTLGYNYRVYKRSHTHTQIHTISNNSSIYKQIENRDVVIVVAADNTNFDSWSVVLVLSFVVLWSWLDCRCPWIALLKYRSFAWYDCW